MTASPGRRELVEVTDIHVRVMNQTTSIGRDVVLPTGFRTGGEIQEIVVEVSRDGCVVVDRDVAGAGAP